MSFIKCKNFLINLRKHWCKIQQTIINEHTKYFPLSKHASIMWKKNKRNKYELLSKIYLFKFYKTVWVNYARKCIYDIMFVIINFYIMFVINKTVSSKIFWNLCIFFLNQRSYSQYDLLNEYMYIDWNNVLE